MSLFNFRLKHPDDVVPWGKEGAQYMHWFGLSDGEYWIETPDAILFEYTSEIVQEFKERLQSRFVDYHVTRFVEDLCDILPAVNISIPDHLFGLVNTHDKVMNYQERVNKWINSNPDEEEETEEEFQDRELLTELAGSRCIDSGYLVNGPHVWIFRNKERITIVWNTDGVSEKRNRYWTAGAGEMEMDYDSFLQELHSFFKSFFDAMERQIIMSIEKDWKSVDLDKQTLAREQIERLSECEQMLQKLSTPAPAKDWSGIERAIRERL